MAGISVSAGSPPFYRKSLSDMIRRSETAAARAAVSAAFWDSFLLPFIAGAPDSHLLRIFNQFITELRMSDGDQFFCSLPGG